MEGGDAGWENATSLLLKAIEIIVDRAADAHGVPRAPPPPPPPPPLLRCRTLALSRRRLWLC